MHLLTPLTIGNHTLKNRVLMAPLTRNRASKDGTPADISTTYYRQRSTAGLIISEATQISAIGKGYIDTPGIYEPSHIAAWRNITQAVHEQDSVFFMQLWHVGRISHTSLLPEGAVPVAPSSIRANAQTYTQEGLTDVSEPIALSVEQIKQTVNDYRHAAQCAKNAGCDGVEIHAANGYLIDQFLQDSSNQRTDAYGGDATARSRFLTEVIEAVLEVFDAGCVGIRLSPLGQFNDMGDSNPLETFSTVIQNLNRYQLAYLHMVEEFPGLETTEAERDILKQLRQQWRGTYIANGGFTRDTGETAIASGHADAIAYGRPFIANPDLPRRFAKDASLITPDQETFYGGDHHGYTDYPFLDEQQAA